MIRSSSFTSWSAIICLLLALTQHVAAQTTPASTISAGDTAWVLTCVALVFLMTPGLAFFYGGLVESHTVLSTLLMSFVCAAIVTVQFFLWGYAIAFGPSNDGIGGKFWALAGVHLEPYAPYSSTIPHLAFFAYQLTFAVITPALISGSIIGRMRFRSWVIFTLIWSTLVYDICAHWVWSAWQHDGTLKYGWLREWGVLDFAGGLVVHQTSGAAAFVCALIVGKRVDHKPHTQAHSVPFVLLGTALLAVGWIGFNAGSALQATDGIAALACVNTFIGSACAFLTWMMLDMWLIKKVSPVGAATSIVVGLVGITPACGFVSPAASMAIGSITAVASYFSMRLKNFFNVDDALDVTACHGVGGFMGSILTGLFANKDFNPAGNNGAFYGNPRLLGIQIAATLIVIAFSAVVTAGILMIIKYIPFLGLRPTEEEERQGLDFVDHGAEAYIINSVKAAAGDVSLGSSPAASPTSAPMQAPAPIELGIVHFDGKRFELVSASEPSAESKV